MNEFLPEGYEIPKEPSQYMKFENGQNKFRILKSPVLGYVYFNSNNKPIRSKTMPKNPQDLGTNKFTGEINRVEHFWGLKVYNFITKRIELLEIKQKTIQSQILSFANDSDWGNPKDFNITIDKKGDYTKGEKVEYLVKFSPKNNEITEEIQKAINETDIDFEEWMRGGKNVFIKKEETKDENDVISSGMPQANFPQEEEFSDEDKAQFGRTFGGQI